MNYTYYKSFVNDWTSILNTIKWEALIIIIAILFIILLKLKKIIADLLGVSEDKLPSLLSKKDEEKKDV